MTMGDSFAVGIFTGIFIGFRANDLTGSLEFSESVLRAFLPRIRAISCAYNFIGTKSS